MSSLVASALIPAAMPSPSIAGEMPVDPIFAAIEAQRASRSEVEEAIAAEGRLIDALPPEDREAERDHARLKGSVCTCDDTGETHTHWLLSHESIEEWEPASRRAKLHAAFDADQAWLEAAWERTGIGAARDRVQAAFDKDREQLTRVCATAPTTLAGLVAFIAFCRREIFECVDGRAGEDLEELALGTLELAARGLLTAEPGALTRHAELAGEADGELLQLGRELAGIEQDVHATARRIDVLPLGAAEDHPDHLAYDEAHKRFDACWGRMRDIRATTLAGLIAKSRYGRREIAISGSDRESYASDCEDCGISIIVDLSMMMQREAANGAVAS